jgi:hypothetical protein
MSAKKATTWLAREYLTGAGPSFPSRIQNSQPNAKAAVQQRPAWRILIARAETDAFGVSPFSIRICEFSPERIVAFFQLARAWRGLPLATVIAYN